MKKKKYKRVLFVPQNIRKYRGKLPIRTRSSWEHKFCMFCDSNIKVLEWNYEGNRISYWNPIKQRNALYIPDFYVKTEKDRFIIEIKPRGETLTTESKSKRTSTRIYSNYMRITNAAKFDAAKKWCDKMGYKFKVITEKELFQYQ